MLFLATVTVAFLMKFFKVIGARFKIFLNKLVIYVLLPVFVFEKISQLKVGDSQIQIGFSMWIVFFVGLIFFRALAYFKKYSQKKWVSMWITSSLGNTAFIGFPLISFFLGESALPHAVVIDQVGTFLLLSVFAYPVILWVSSSVRHRLVWTVAKRMLIFPPFIAFVLGAGANFSGFTFGLGPLVWLTRLLPFATLFLVGMMIEANTALWKKYRHEVCWGLFYKLVVCPVMLLFVYRTFSNVEIDIQKIVFLEAAMAPMITSSLLLQERNVEPDLSAMIVNLGIVLSAITVPFCYYLLQFIYS